MRHSLALLSLVSLCACGTEKLEHAGDPVPPEQQGECETGTFRARELESLDGVLHTEALRWAGWTELGSDDAMLELELSLDADEIAAHPGCASYVELPAKLTIESNDGLLGLEAEGILAAAGPSRARLGVQTPASELGALHQALAPLLTPGDADYRIELLLGSESLEGTLGLRRGAGAAACDVAGWPALRRCPLGVAETQFDEPVRGFDVPSVVAELNALGPLSLGWDDGSTTLTLESEVGSVAYCLHQAVPDASGKPSATVRADFGVQLRLVSADQNLDVQLPARVALDIDEDGVRTATTLRAHALAPSDATAVFGIAAPRLAVVELALELLDDGTSTGELWVRQLSPQAGALVPRDISPACLSTDLLGSFDDVAHGTW